jgi:uncharacterized protein YcnI
MTTIARWSSRALFTAAMTTSAMSIGLFIGAAPASAHVHVEAENAVRGGSSVLTFEVPNESDKGALTTQLTVALPNVSEANTEVMPGWSARLDHDTASGITRSVTWTAAPGGGIPPDQFALFRIEVQLPNTDTASFPATQTYSDGTVVQWNQPTPAGGAEPEFPVPMLTLSAKPAEGPAPAKASDSTARWLGGAGIAVGAIGLLVALATLAMRRRS